MSQGRSGSIRITMCTNCLSRPTVCPTSRISPPTRLGRHSTRDSLTSGLAGRDDEPVDALPEFEFKVISHTVDRAMTVMIKPGLASMLQDGTIFDDDHLPSMVVGRNSQMNEITDALAPIQDGFHGENYFLFGSSGAGKMTQNSVTSR